uniref:C-type lectin domain-containing protein n=1 Tax=Sus scrofa TaxID=9823 RepID=A0A8D1MW86_PIG
MVPSRIRFHCATTGTPSDVNFKLQNKFTFCSNSVGVSTLDAYYIYCAYLFYTDFPWHTIAIVLGIVCFFLLLTTTVLGYTYFQSRGKNMECTKERNTSGTEPSVLQPFIDKDCGTCQGKWFCCGKDCYYFSKEEKSWDESAKLCRVLGSSLIKIDDQKEQLFIQSKINYNHWVGLRRKGANHPWKWQDGSLLSKNLNFQESTSDAKCGSLKSPNITPDICTREFHYICEKVFTCLNN